MKKILNFMFLFFLVFSLSSQTATSMSDGNWLNPLTWDCMCIPLPGYSITINHQVTLDTDFMFTSGEIYINSGGSLIQNTQNRNIWVAGTGYLSNSGTLEVKNLLYEGTNGSLMNAGTLIVGNLHLTTGFDNIGNATADSLMNNSFIANYGDILATAFTNGNTFVNSGTMSYTDFLNTGSFQNEFGIIQVNNNMWNQGIAMNSSGSKILIGNNLLNSNPFNFNARIVNDAYIFVGNSLYNNDTLKGNSNGYVQVADSSVNSGYFIGTFDFCDLTPPASAPFIDINTGTVDPGITWCAQQKIVIYNNREIKLFPNPVSDILHFHIVSFSEGIISIVDMKGKMVYIEPLSGTDGLIDLSHLPAGLYVFIASGSNGLRTYSVFLVK